MKILICLSTVFLVSACATSVPQNISQAPTPNPSLAEVLAQPDAHKGEFVRWGGVVLAVAKPANQTEIEIQVKQVDSSGKPISTDLTQGRFLAKLAAGVEPAQPYAPGSMVTIYGMLDSVQTRSIAEKPYDYPLINVQKLYTWSAESDYNFPDYYSCGPLSMTAVAGIYPYGYSFGYGRCF